MSYGSMVMSGLQMGQNRKIAKENTKFNYWQVAQQERFAKQGFGWLVDQYKQQGLHPMLAAGATPVNMSPVYNQQPMQDFSNMGQAIDKVIGKNENKAFRQANLRILLANADKAEAEAIMAQNASIGGQNPIDLPSAQIPSAGAQKVPKQIIGAGSDPSAEYGLAPLEMWSRAQNGYLIRSYNKDIGDTMEAIRSLMDKLKHYD